MMRYAAATFLTLVSMFAQETAKPAAPGVAQPGAGPWAASRAEILTVVLGLNPDQKAQVEKLFADEAGQLKPLEPQLRDNRQAIRQLAMSDMIGGAFETKLQALAATEASLVSRITTIHARTLAHIWWILTPAQQQKAAQLKGLLELGAPGSMGLGSRHMRPRRPAQTE
jgi:Spy/CpxP family protein refolding chaperone